jgi:peptidoglycan/LPS O-acetylase OafA/YrhL
MRIEFFSRLALLLAAAVLVVATQVWATNTLEWLFIVGGIVMLVLAGAPGAAGNRRQRTLSGVIAIVGILTILQALVFTGNTLMWVSFGAAVLAGLLAIAGLIEHETSTERVVHELQVTPAGARHGAFAS